MFKDRRFQGGCCMALNWFNVLLEQARNGQGVFVDEDDQEVPIQQPSMIASPIASSRHTVDSILPGWLGWGAATQYIAGEREREQFEMGAAAGLADKFRSLNYQTALLKRRLEAAYIELGALDEENHSLFRVNQKLTKSFKRVRRQMEELRQESFLNRKSWQTRSIEAKLSVAPSKSDVLEANVPDEDLEEEKDLKLIVPSLKKCGGKDGVNNNCDEIVDDFVESDDNSVNESLFVQ